MLDRNDIDQYISSLAEESINLEFKRGDALSDKNKAEIAKDVSAFANSDGGVIIYGIEEKEHKASGLFFVNGFEFTKEWLEQVINSRIHRKITGLIIDPIRYDDKIEQSVYAVTIPRSVNAPHMVDGKFYRRYNFQSIVMEEYEVRNLYMRQDKTELELVIPKFSARALRMQAGKLNQLELQIEFNILNKGETIEKYFKLDIQLPDELIKNVENTRGYDRYGFFKYLVKKENNYLHFTIPAAIPLYQNERATIGTATLVISYENYASLGTTPINLILRYSNGIEEKSILAIDHFTYQGWKLSIDNFSR